MAKMTKDPESIEEGIARLLRRKRAARISEVTEFLVECWGGAKALAEAMKETYDHSPVGGPVRAKILDRVLALMESEAPQEDELNEYDEETLVSVILERVKREHGQVHQASAEGLLATENVDSGSSAPTS